MAAKLGTSRFVIADAEKGKVTTGIGIYMGLLWALHLLHQIDGVASPENDQEGTALSIADGRKRAGSAMEMDNDF